MESAGHDVSGLTSRMRKITPPSNKSRFSKQSTNDFSVLAQTSRRCCQENYFVAKPLKLCDANYVGFTSRQLGYQRVSKIVSDKVNLLVVVLGGIINSENVDIREGKSSADVVVVFESH